MEERELRSHLGVHSLRVWFEIGNTTDSFQSVSHSSVRTQLGSVQAFGDPGVETSKAKLLPERVFEIHGC